MDRGRRNAAPAEAGSATGVVGGVEANMNSPPAGGVTAEARFASTLAYSRSRDLLCARRRFGSRLAEIPAGHEHYGRNTRVGWKCPARTAPIATAWPCRLAHASAISIGALAPRSSTGLPLRRSAASSGPT